MVETVLEQHCHQVTDDLITVRPASTADIDEVIRVCRDAWKGIWEGNVEMFRDRIETFPQGGIVVAELNGRIEGYVSIQVSNKETTLCPKWNEATDNGHFKNTHDVNGDWIHGAGLAVTPQGSRGGVVAVLIEYLGQYIVSSNKRGARFITRIPGYHMRSSEMTPVEYVAATHRSRPLDPELRVMAKYGFFVTNPPMIFSDYVEGGGDPASCGKSVLIERLNLLFQED